MAALAQGEYRFQPDDGLAVYAVIQIGIAGQIKQFD
jgi:hypothetical protein